MANGFVLKSTNQVKKRAKAVVKVAKSQQNIFIFVSSSKKGPKRLYVFTTCKKFRSSCEDGTKMKIDFEILLLLCALLFCKY